MRVTSLFVVLLSLRGDVLADGKLGCEVSLMDLLLFTNRLAHQEGHHNKAAEVKLNDQYLKPFFGRVFLSLCELKEEKKGE